MVGIDIIQISRLNPSNHSFVERILSDYELKEFNNRKESISYLAGRWAAKEAFLKCLNKGILSIDLKQIEVLSRDNGAPYIKFQNQIYENVSISHEKDYAVAIVII